MPIYEVEFDGTFYRVHIDEETNPPLLMGGQPITGFHEGWKPIQVYGDLAPLFLLELVHTSGAESIWWIDENFNHLSTDAEALGTVEQAALIEVVEPLFDRFWREVFMEAEVQPSLAVIRFLRLSASARVNLYSFWNRRVSRPTPLWNLSQDPESWPRPTNFADFDKLGPGKGHS